MPPRKRKQAAGQPSGTSGGWTRTTRRKMVSQTPPAQATVPEQQGGPEVKEEVRAKDIQVTPRKGAQARKQEQVDTRDEVVEIGGDDDEDIIFTGSQTSNGGTPKGGDAFIDSFFNPDSATKQAGKQASKTTVGTRARSQRNSKNYANSRDDTNGDDDDEDDDEGSDWEEIPAAGPAHKKGKFRVELEYNYDLSHHDDANGMNSEQNEANNVLANVDTPAALDDSIQRDKHANGGDQQRLLQGIQRGDENLEFLINPNPKTNDDTDDNNSTRTSRSRREAKGKSPKAITKEQRLFRRELHKTHLLTLFFAAYIKFKWTFSKNSSILGSKILQVIPPELKEKLDMGPNGKNYSAAVSQREKFIVHQVKNLLRWWHNRIHIRKNIKRNQSFDSKNLAELIKKWDDYIAWGAHNISRRQAAEVIPDTDYSTSRRGNGSNIPNIGVLMPTSDLDVPEHLKFSPNDISILFMICCNSLNIPVRMVSSLHPLPLTFAKATETAGYFKLLPSGKSAGEESKIRAERRKIKRMAAKAIGIRPKPKPHPNSAEGLFGSAITDSDDDENPYDSKMQEMEVNEGYPWRHLRIWCEIYSKWKSEWIAVDPVRDIVGDRTRFEPKPSVPDQHQLIYVVGMEPGHGVKDISQFYTSEWHARLSKMRISGGNDNLWWDTILWLFSGDRRNIDRKEELKMQKKSLNEPIPNSLGKFKNHPLYALEKLLKTNEIIYPTGQEYSVGVYKSDLVYKRSSVSTLRTPEAWLRLGKRVKSQQTPLRYTNSSSRSKVKKTKSMESMISSAIRGNVEPVDSDTASMDMDDNNSSTGSINVDSDAGGKPLFGYWQTETYVAHPIGPTETIPRNTFGNFEIFHQNMIPKGTSHIDLPGGSIVCKKLGVEFVPVVVGFEFSGGAMVPKMSGVIIHTHQKDLVVNAIIERESFLQVKREERRKQALFKDWKRLILAVMTKDRLQKQYGDGIQQQALEQQEKNKEKENRNGSSSTKGVEPSSKENEKKDGGEGGDDGDGDDDDDFEEIDATTQTDANAYDYGIIDGQRATQNDQHEEEEDDFFG